jgi:hypothetical protein
MNWKSVTRKRDPIVTIYHDRRIYLNSDAVKVLYMPEAILFFTADDNHSGIGITKWDDSACCLQLAKQGGMIGLVPVEVTREMLPAGIYTMSDRYVSIKVATPPKEEE